jgi:hypothetical protein
MVSLFSTLVSLAILLAAGGLIVWHVRTWRRAERKPSEGQGFDYYRRQYRRRMQTSALLAVVAVAIFVGQFITRPPVAVLVFWGGVLLVLFWIGLLAVADVVATKLHFAQLRAHYRVEEAKLQMELRRIRSTRGNGKPPNGDE